MGQLEALGAALAILQRPQLARLTRRSALPDGVTFLLEVAAGEPKALVEAQQATGRSYKELKDAAGFFVEQVLLKSKTDSYRILGAARDASNVDLRRHMALIFKWLHPDVVADRAGGKSFDRSAYASLVTEAWETLKTEERRAAYDATLVAKQRSLRNGQPRPASRASMARSARSPLFARGRQPALHRLKYDTFWGRLLSYLGR